MYCQRCGNILGANESYCQKCGYLRQAVSQPQNIITPTQSNHQLSNNQGIYNQQTSNNSTTNSQHNYQYSQNNQQTIYHHNSFNNIQMADNQKLSNSQLNNSYPSYNQLSNQSANYQQIPNIHANNQQISVIKESYHPPNHLVNNYLQQPIQKNNNAKIIFTGITLGFGLLIIFVLCLYLINNNHPNYYFSDDNYESEEEVVDNSSQTTTNKYSTVIITDNTYKGVSITDTTDAYQLISKDSVNQKDNCPEEILSIENELIEKYNITAVNLCEMDINFAKELVNVVKIIYEEYPNTKGYLTNLTLINASMTQSYIAAFMPIFTFAESDTTSTYPWVIKTQILLNTKYFLNPEKLQIDVTASSDVGHFPPNATIYSPLAHEFGHYLSFLAMMNSYDVDSIILIDSNNLEGYYSIYSDFVSGKFSLTMINEAYENYQKDTNTTLSIDEWRATISKYAVAKNNSGEYIYDETIAEAFHDVYLNGDNAKDASKYVIKVLKEKLGEI